MHYESKPDTLYEWLQCLSSMLSSSAVLSTFRDAPLGNLTPTQQHELQDLTVMLMSYCVNYGRPPCRTSAAQPCLLLSQRQIRCERSLLWRIGLWDTQGQKNVNLVWLKPQPKSIHRSGAGEPELCVYKNNNKILLCSSLHVEIQTCCDHRSKNGFLPRNAKSS